MELVLANVKNETAKLLLKKKTIFFLITTVFIPVFLAFALPLFNNRLGVSVVNGANFPVFVLGIFTNAILPLFVAMVSIDIFSGELRERTLKIILLQPISRFKIFLSKVASVGIYICMNLGLVFVVSVLMAVLRFNSQGFAWSLWSDVKTYAVAFVPMITIAVAAVFAAQFFKSSSGALVLLIIVYAASKAVPYFSAAVSRVIFLSYTDWHLMWLGSVSAAKLLSIFILQLSYGIIFFSLGFYLFDRREL